MEAINLAIFAVILAFGAVAIPWARSQAEAARRQWELVGKPRMDEAAQQMERLNADLQRAAESLSRSGDAVVERVRRDTGVATRGTR
jgi:hypothetical protein